MRKNEHPGCGCTQCKRGRRTGFGHYVQKQVSKTLRRRYRAALRMYAPDDVGQIIVSTPYTD